MGTNYNQLSEAERIAIAVLLKGGVSVRGIAKELSRSPSTIAREIQRHFPGDRQSDHLWQQAHQKATWLRRNCRRRKRLKNAEIESYVREKLLLRWSPEQIAGRISKDHPHLSISHEAIYQFIYAEAREFIPILPRSGKRKLKRSSRKQRRINQIPARNPIEQRCEAANLRYEFGHWEVDTAFSLRGKCALLICTERKTRLTKLARLASKRAQPVRKGVVSRLAQYPRDARRSLTYDNGTENIQHQEINRALGTQSFFCAPYHS